MQHLVPTRDAIVKILDALNSGDLTRSEVASWAIAIVDDDDIRVNDRVVLQVLKRLGAVALQSTDRDYLYTKIDFEDWKAEILQGM